jgi:hypothetical protein
MSRRQHPAVVKLVRLRWRHERHESLGQLLGGQLQRRRAVRTWPLQMQAHAVSRQRLDPPLRERRPRDVAGEPPQALPVAGSDDDAGVQDVAVARRAQRLQRELSPAELLHPAGLVLSDGRPPGHRLGLEQRQRVVRVAVVVVLRFGAKTPPREPRLAPGGDADHERVTVPMFIEDAAAQRQGLAVDARLAWRQERIAPISRAFRAWLDQVVPTLTPSSPLAKASRYMTNHREALTRFLVNLDIPMSNNASERLFRPLDTGRLNWLFAGSPEAAHNLAVLMGLVATCRLQGVDPWPTSTGCSTDEGPGGSDTRCPSASSRRLPTRRHSSRAKLALVDAVGMVTEVAGPRRWGVGGSRMVHFGIPPRG